MRETPELKAGDPCPVDGGRMVLDETQAPERLIERHSRNAHHPFVATRFAERVREKAEEYGLIHKCSVCGYRSRFKVENGDRNGSQGQGSQGQGSQGSSGGSASRDERGRFAGGGRGGGNGEADRERQDRDRRELEQGYREEADRANRDNR